MSINKESTKSFYSSNPISTKFESDAFTKESSSEWDSSQINEYLSDLAQWFHKASHITQLKLLCDLITRLNDYAAYDHLNKILFPFSKSKDLIYTRNKLLPSCEQDHLKATNNRCLTTSYISAHLNQILNWYRSSCVSVKLNFILRVLKLCDQVLIYALAARLEMISNKRMVVSPLTSLTSRARSAFAPGFKHFSNTNAFSKTVANIRNDLDDLADDVEDFEFELFIDVLNNDYDDSDSSTYLNKSVIANTLKKKYVDFVRMLPIHLSKLILNKLDIQSLHTCLFVSKFWYRIVKEVRKEVKLHRTLIADVLLLRVRVCFKS
jgi:hypothetical protein